MTVHGRYVLALLVAAGLAAPAAARSPSGDPANASLTAALLKLEAERQDAYVAGDQAVLERQFAAEYMHTNLHGGITRRAEELAFYRPGVFTLKSGAFTGGEVRDYGDAAVLTGEVDWVGATYRPAPDKAVDLSGRFRVTRVYVWRDGRWQLSASHASLIPAAAATAPH